MRFRWTGLSREPALPTGAQRRVERVLIDLDGPQLVLAKDDDDVRYLGLAADEDRHAQRWIYAPLGDMELEALCAGAISMKNALCKEKVDVVDIANGSAKAVWRTSPDAVPPTILPVDDANLPAYIGEDTVRALGLSPGTTQGAPYFRCGGDAVRGHSISFSAIAGIASTLQGLWSAIAGVVLPEPSIDGLEARADDTTLRMAAAPGSFSITLPEASGDTFRALADAYRSLVRMAPAEAQKVYSSEVMRPYGEYLKTLDRLGVEVFAQLGDAAAYIGPSYAARTRKTVSALVRAAASSAPRRTPSTSLARGFLSMSDITARRFKFLDTITNKEIQGDILAAVVKKMEKHGDDFHVGRHTLYNAQIRRVAGRSTIVNLEEAQKSLFRR